MKEREIDSVTLAEWLKNDDTFLIDVREADEHASELIKGSLSYPLSTFSPSEIASVAGDSTIVFHCRGGHRSESALIKFLEKYPNKNAFHLKGGMHAWKVAGFPVHTPSFKKDSLI